MFKSHGRELFEPVHREVDLRQRGDEGIVRGHPSRSRHDLLVPGGEPGRSMRRVKMAGELGRYSQPSSVSTIIVV